MTTTQSDGRGIIETCPECGQRNRVPYAALGNRTRCGRCQEKLEPLAAPLEIAQADDFQSLLQEVKMAVLVDFWADWCGPCKMMAPEFSRMAAQNSGKVLLVKINTEL